MSSFEILSRDDRFDVTVRFSKTESISIDFKSKSRSSPASAGDDPNYILKRLSDLSRLPEGWEFGKGIPPLPMVLRKAVFLCVYFRCTEIKMDAFPCSDGSLYFVLYRGSNSLEIRLEADESVDFTFETEEVAGTNEVYTCESATLMDISRWAVFLDADWILPRLPQVEVRELIQLWDTLDSSIPSTMIKREDVSAAPASAIPAMEAESPLLKSLALSESPVQSAPTFVDTTSRSLAFPPSSGGCLIASPLGYP